MSGEREQPQENERGFWENNGRPRWTAR